MKEGFYMPANNKTMTVTGEGVVKAEKDEVVANCDLKRGTERPMSQTHL
jgi:hypothetical protein